MHKYINKYSLMLHTELRQFSQYTGYATGWLNRDLGIKSWQKQKNFLFFTELRPALGPTKPAILKYKRLCSQIVKLSTHPTLN